MLDEVPPHLVPDQLVAEARRAGGVPVGLYVVDIDGSQLIRLAGTEDFPDHLDAPPALGPEIVPEGLPGFQRQLGVSLPGCTLEPLWLRGRITALFLCVGTPVASLADVAKQGAAALDLANDYTDAIEAARRRKPPTPAAEIQQNLLPPRIARITGAQLAGGLLPTYEVGGDWFDFVENRDGSWLAIGDAAGNGPTAAGLGAAALGALRASRRSGQGIEEALLSMDETVRRHQGDDLYVSTVIARWQPATSMLTWVNCGHPHAYLVNREGRVAELTGPDHAALGRGASEAQVPADSAAAVSRRADTAGHRRRHRPAHDNGRVRYRGRAGSGRRLKFADGRCHGDGPPAGCERQLGGTARGRRHRRCPLCDLSGPPAGRERGREIVDDRKDVSGRHVQESAGTTARRGDDGQAVGWRCPRLAAASRPAGRSRRSR